jgi:uncharacterized protein involved in exopolysaccharide biosynthesis
MNPASTAESPDLPPAAPPAQKELNLDPVRALRMHRLPAIAVAALVTLGVFGFGLSRRPYYETQALIYVQPEKTRLVSDNSQDVYDSSRYESYIQQQLQTIPRSDILAQALAQPQAQAWRFPHEPLQVAIIRLQHSLKVERVEQSYELSIGLSGNNPNAIAGMVNAICDAYIHGERADELAQTDQQLQILNADRDHITAELTNDRQQQAALSVTLGVADTTASDTGNPFDTGLVELRSDLAKAVAAHDLAVADLDAIGSGHANAAENLGAAASALVNTDPGLASFKQSTAQRSSVIASQMSGLKPENPLYQQDQTELDQLDRSLLTMEQHVRARAIRQVEQDREQEVRRTAAVVARLQAQLATNTAAATRATPELQHAAELAADITRLQTRYNTVDNAISSIELDKDTSGLVHVLLPALPPLAPKTSLKRTILAAALPLGVIAGIATAMALLMFDPRIFIAKDISRTLRFYPLATLPSRDEVGKIVSDEFLLRLLAGVDQIHRADRCQTFVFTSASAGEGLNDLVESLARKMQRLGYSVVTMKAADLIEEDKLSSGIMPAAGATPRPSSTHESFILQKIDSLKKQADFVLIEARPLLASSVAEFTARLCDVVILIAESGKTTRTELRAAVDLIRRLRTPGMAAVLCKLLLRNADTAFIKAVESVEADRTEA